MAENFSLSELVIPGTFIRVRADALISAGGISTGNIGIVGTAERMRPVLNEDGTPVLDDDNNPTFEKDTDIYSETHVLSDYDSARTALGDYDAIVDADGIGSHNLTRSLELLYQNGARVVYARPLDPVTDPGPPEYTAAFNELIKDNINILVAPELTTEDAVAVMGGVLLSAEENGTDLMAVIGSDQSAPNDILAQITANDRIIMATPGVRAFDAVSRTNVNLNGRFTAATVAGLLSTLAPQSSPTNKVLPGVVKLAQRFSYGDTERLVGGRALVLEERQGARVVRGLTTDDGAFTQITTRRITDFAKAGIRQVGRPFIGRLNNERVRKALQGAIDGFLTTMVQDEQLISYTLEVTATRQDEIAGRAMVNVVIEPTFSIDFIAVTMVLQ